MAEACDGTNAACPTDAKQASATPCTDDNNPCTTDTCDGTSDTCQHAAGNANAECRAAAGECDVAEACDGTNAACPADAFKDQNTVCRAAVDACDIAETCTGSGAACPDDVVRTGNDAFTCAFGNSVDPSVCEAQSVPAGILKKFTAADSLVARALGKSGKAQQRALKKAMAKLRQAIKLVNKAEGRQRNPISSACASPIRDVLTDALNRLLTIA